MPIATVHDPTWDIPTYAYVNVSPDTVGVNQPVIIVFWLDKITPTAAGSGGDRWSNLQVEITKLLQISSIFIQVLNC